jgi:hypothetical protein
MSHQSRSRTSFAVLATLVIASTALAQTTPTTAAGKTKPATTPAPAPRETSSGVATGKRQDQFPKASGATAVIPPTADAADAKKHIAGVKYEDRQATSQQTLDATSKDAAKAPVTTLDGASKDAAKSKTIPPTAQDSKRENKIDSFSIKQ